MGSFDYNKVSTTSKVPVGGLVPMFGVGNNPTIEGAEYLRSAVLKSINGYDALRKTSQGLCWNVGKEKGSTAAAHTILVFTNGNYYAFGGAAPKYSADLVTWAALTTDVTGDCNDAFVFGNYVIHVSAVATTNYSISVTTGTAINTTVAQLCGAVNAAGTLGVMAANANANANYIWTSVNGSAWTSRTPSGGASAAIYRAAWSVAANAFVYLTANGHAYTTTDGYTLTDRGLIGSYTVIEQLSPASKYSAYSSTANLFSVNGTYAGVAATLGLIRTTDGVNYTAQTWLSLTGIEPGGIPVIQYSNGIFTATYNPVMSADEIFAFQSADDGASWVRMAVPISTNTSNTSFIQLSYMNGEYVALPITPATYKVFTTPSLEATHVGLPLRSTQLTTSGTTLTNYVRIK